MKILIDNGHGVETPGKRSPDGRFREFAYTRLIASGVVQHLLYRGYYAELLVPEVTDVPLKERVRRVNKQCRELGKDRVCLVSIHVNAAGKEGWHNATGWSCYTSKGQTAGDKLADCLAQAALVHLAGHKMRFDNSDGDPDQERDFYLLRHTKCAAVITENGFQDCEESLRFLESDEGKKSIVGLHVEGIVEYVKKMDSLKFLGISD